MKYNYLGEDDFKSRFYDEIIEVDCGRHFDEKNEKHIDWLNRRIKSVFLLGGKVLACFSNDDEPVGFLFFQHDKGLENTCCFGKKAHIIMFEIKEKYRSMGIGRDLLSRVCEGIKAEGGECLYTDTYVPNKRAIKFYVENDFVPVAVHHGENGIDDFGQIYLYKVLK